MRKSPSRILFGLDASKPYLKQAPYPLGSRLGYECGFDFFSL